MLAKGVICTGVLLLTTMNANAGDLAGSRDPAFLKRYQGSEIVNYESRPFDGYQIAHIDPKNTQSYAFTELDGQLTRIVYHAPPGHTVLELLRNYEQALKDAGLQQTYEKPPFQDQNFGSLFYHQGWEAVSDYMWSYLGLGGVQQMAYVTAKGNKNGHNVDVAVYIQDYAQPHDVNYGKPVHFNPGELTIVVDVVNATPWANHMVFQGGK